MKTKFICEVGSNHNQSLDKCFRFIDAAKELGCWGIKFQLFQADKLWTKPETIAKMSHWELPSEFMMPIREHCNSVDINLGVSVFSTDYINWLDGYVDFFKIGSYEILCVDMIKACYATGKLLFISAGLIEPRSLLMILNDVDSDWKKRSGNILVYHCNSNYPAKVENCNLIKMQALMATMPEMVGWSDHSVEPGVIYQAIAHGAKAIEFHLDLAGNGNEYDNGHCWIPSEINNVIKTVRVMEKSRGGLGKGIDSNLLSMRTDPITMKRGY